MPTYEFRCPSGHDFEKFYRSIGTAPSEVHCPICGKVSGRQMSAGGGLVFKGSGFYITDYGKDGKKSQTPAVAAGESAVNKSAGDAETSKSESSSGGDSGSSAASPAPSGESKPSPDSKPSGDSKPATTRPPKKPKTSE